MPIRFDPSSQEVLRRAQVEAGASVLLWPRAEHLLVALLDDPSVIEALVAMGVDPMRLAQNARDHLAARPPTAPADRPLHRRLWRWLFPPMPRDVLLVQRHAAALVLMSARTDITPLDLLVALSRLGDQMLLAPTIVETGDAPYRRARASIAHPVTAMREAGVTTAALLRYLAHGEGIVRVDAPPRFAPDELVELEIINDDYTSIEFVVTVLCEEVGLSRVDAEQLALDVHRVGVGLVGTFRFAHANQLLGAIERRATASGFPLKLFVMPAPSPTQG